MKKVVIVAPMEANGRYRGGIMTVANTLFSSRKKFLRHGIYLDKFNTYIRKREANSIGKTNIYNILNMLDIIKGLLKITKGKKCDVLYYHTSIKMALMKDLLVIRVLRLFNRKQRIVLHIHFAEIKKILPSNKIFSLWMLKTMNKQVDHIIFLSEKTRIEFIDAGINKNKTSVVYNFHAGLADSTIVEEKCARISTKEKIDCIFMGSIEKRKGIVDLLTAIERGNFEITLHICGSSSDESVQSEYTEKVNKLQTSVVEHGFVTGQEKERLLLCADCMILPSYGEGFPLVIIDAMANGCTCITTPVGAVPEFFKELENGYMFAPGDIDELICCIRKVIHNRKQTAYQMRKNYLLAENFSIDCFIDVICKIL